MIFVEQQRLAFVFQLLLVSGTRPRSRWGRHVRLPRACRFIVHRLGSGLLHQASRFPAEHEGRDAKLFGWPAPYKLAILVDTACSRSYTCTRAPFLPSSRPAQTGEYDDRWLMFGRAQRLIRLQSRGSPSFLVSAKENVSSACSALLCSSGQLRRLGLDSSGHHRMAANDAAPYHFKPPPHTRVGAHLMPDAPRCD